MIRMSRAPSTSPGLREASGFTLVELLISVSLAVVVLGTAVAITADVQRGYSHALEDGAAQQEARYALDWVARVVAAAGGNSYGVAAAAVSACGAGPFSALVLDPDGNGVHDDLRVQSDVNPPNGLLVGDGVDCDEPGEDVTIALDRAERVLTRRDLATDAGPVPATDAVFTDLRFVYFTAEGDETTVPHEITMVRIVVTAESRARHPATGAFTRFTLRREVRIRSRQVPDGAT